MRAKRLASLQLILTIHPLRHNQLKANRVKQKKKVLLLIPKLRKQHNPLFPRQTKPLPPPHPAIFPRLLTLLLQRLQSVANTMTLSNTQSTIATISPASTPEKEAHPALSVPRLADPGSEEQEAEQQADVSPEMVVQRSIEDLYAAHSMSNLQLRDDSVPGTDPGLDNITSGGPGPNPDNQNPATQQPLSSTPNRPLQEPQSNLSVSATVSSDQLGSTIHAAHDSTTSLTGYDSASNIFHTDASSSIPAVQPTGPNVSESVTDPGMEQEQGASQTEDDAMDTTHQDAYSQHTENTKPVVQPETNNLSSTDAGQTARLMDQLFQAQRAGTLADLTSQLHGQQAEQLMKILQLAREVGQPTGTEQDNSSVLPDTGTDSDPDSSIHSGTDSEGVTTDASDPNRRRSATRHRLAPAQAQQMLEQSDRDVIVIDEQVEVTELETIHLTTGWGKGLEQEEANWPTRFPVRKPFIKPRVEQVGDKWYQREDCVDPSGIAPPATRAILPAADGTLSLRRDAAMPGASRGRTLYKTRDLVRRLSYEKGKRVGGKLTKITSVELIAVTRNRRSCLLQMSSGKPKFRIHSMSLVRTIPRLTLPTIRVSGRHGPSLTG